MIGDFSRWLLHDDQQELFNILFALVLNIIFVVLITLLLWPFGILFIAFQLLKGYSVLWIASIFTLIVLKWVQRLFRINMYERYNAFVISNLAISLLLQFSWSIFVVLVVQSGIAEVSIWGAIGLHSIAFIACLVGFYIVSAFYTGEIYRLISLPGVLVSFLLFSLWPAGAQAVYGWFL